MSDSGQVCPGHHTIEHPAPALRTDEYLCRGCLRHAERVIGDIPALVRELEVTVTRQSRTYRAAGAGREPEQDWRGTDHALAATPSPADLDAAAKGRTACELLFEWADAVAAWHQVKGLPLFTRDRPLTDLAPAACAILLRHADWMRSNEQGPDLAHAVWCVRRDLRRLVDTRPERLYAGPCLADLGYDSRLGYLCQLPLHREWGRDDITCDGHAPNTTPRQWAPTGCGAVHDIGQRREWLRADVEARLLPLRLVWESLYELVPGCAVDWATAKRWTRERHERIPVLDKSGRQKVDRRGRPMVRIHVVPPRLDPQGWSGDTPLYRGSDVLRLAEDKPVRRGRRRAGRSKVA